MEGQESNNPAEVSESEATLQPISPCPDETSADASDGHAPRSADAVLPDSTPWYQHLFGAMGAGTLFAMIGLPVGFRLLTNHLLRHILSPGEGISYLEVTDGLPVPHLLDWNLDAIAWMAYIRDAGGPFLLVPLLVFAGILWTTAAAALNPTFRLFENTPLSSRSPGDDPAPPKEESPPIKNRNSALDHQKTKALVLMLSMFLVTAIAAQLTGLIPYLLANHLTVSPEIPEVPPPSWAFWLMLLGGVLWVSVSRHGLAGDFSERAWNRVGSALAGLLAAGAGFGLAVYALMRWATPPPLSPTLTAYQTLGTFNRNYAHFIGERYLFSITVLWFASGILLYALGRPGLSLQRRGALFLLPLVAVLLAVFAQRPFAPKTLSVRLDITPQVEATEPVSWQRRIPASGVPDGPFAGQQLAQRVGLPWSPPSSSQLEQPVLGNVPGGVVTGDALSLSASAPERSILLFLDKEVRTARQSLLTRPNLSADPATAAPVRDYLRRYDYQTALSWVAIEHLFDISTTQFDTHGALETLLLDMTHCPHLAQTGRDAYSMFFICNTSPQNLALLDQYADETNFAQPDRDSRRLMGQLYARFGALDKAMLWFHRADMPHSFFLRTESSKPLFRRGHVTGVLRLNGKPLAGAPVGVVPRRLNALPLRVNELLSRAIFELTGQMLMWGRSGPLARGHPSPLAFRWVSAGTTTNANGAFSLDYLTEGEYYLIVALPSSVRLEPGINPMPIRNRPAPIELNYDTPSRDLGIIDMTAPGT